MRWPLPCSVENKWYIHQTSTQAAWLPTGVCNLWDALHTLLIIVGIILVPYKPEGLAPENR